ncbi:cytochrome b subunit of succinate dehydrogenase, Sdh3p [Hymenopellis radicata]|nr:cytochrome b subunit of succinate dehydrogenase, Sdh3p [Hymenopellis radicata]
MITSRIGMSPALRRAVFAPRLARLQANVIAKRSIQTESLPPSSAVEILNKQRLQRPTSPHMTIYRHPLPSVLSGAHRATGLALGALLYSFSLAYLIAPGTFDSAHIVEFVAGLPEVVKYGAKTLLAFPFAYHSYNGIRHLVWDAGKFLNVKGAYSTGYALMGVTAVSTVALVLM